MYIPKNFLVTDQNEVIEFMKRYSFATMISVEDKLPVATHLPFVISERGEDIMLTAHFARANTQWERITEGDVLVIFTEPHAYISPKNYDHERNVPTWNYIAVHAYGTVKLLQDVKQTLDVLEATIVNYESGYKAQWDRFDESYKLKMIKGIVAFELTITDLQAKKKLSQNRTETEKTKIISDLSQRESSHERDLANFMRK
ncbi:FMN-binding negative transcriptional regulator [Pedobacter duraquae]|uniref:PaiB family negative transcriptional regulator n=1 Tax=Pedobacter duraquae TaxID=425511 RepID=A0A4R6IQP2_9SPHI|nr:FMN-binding negative transcriptional regulator [Pedobacter duraquae]TDO24659.1 PaiB family negative transcriptional regulator [Pedobacter duraquae]